MKSDYSKFNEMSVQEIVNELLAEMNGSLSQEEYAMLYQAEQIISAENDDDRKN